MWRVLSGTEAGTSALPHPSLATCIVLVYFLIEGLLLYKTAGLMTQKEHWVPAAWRLCCSDRNPSQEVHSPFCNTHTHTQLLKSWVLLINTVLRAQTLSVAVVSTGQGCVVCLLWLLNILPKRARWAWIIRSTWHFHRSPSMAVYGSFIFSLRDTS